MSSNVSIEKMNEVMEITNKANSELASIVTMVNSLHDRMSTKVTEVEIRYNNVKETIEDYLNKLSSNSPIDEEALNVLLAEDSECKAIVSLTKQLEEKIALVEQVKEALMVKKLSDALTKEQLNEEGSIDVIDIDDDYNNNEMDIDNENEMNDSNRHQYNANQMTRRKRNRRKRKDEDDDDESYTLSDKDKSNIRSSNSNISSGNSNNNNNRKGNSNYNNYNNNRIHNKDNNAVNTIIHNNKEREKIPFIFCRRKRRPLFFCNNSVKLDKYSILSTNPFFFNPNLSFESSDFLPSSITIDQNDNLPQLTKERDTLKPQVLNDLDPKKYSQFLILNFNRFMHTRTLYFSSFDMLLNPPECNYEYFPFDHRIITNMNGLNGFRYVKLVLIRIPGGKIQNVILGCRNLFDSEINRKDIDGNTMIKGELKVSFETFQSYFLSGIKGFSQLSEVQIEVFLHKNELFEDYNEVIDKSNLAHEVLTQLSERGERLKRLRIIDKKIKLISSNKQLEDKDKNKDNGI